MRAIRVALAVALIAPVLAAQAPVRHAAANVGALEVDLHYNPGADNWVTTNKPAYVAVFDLTRTSASMIYPTFSAQAEHPIFSGQRIVNVPSSAFSSAGMFGGGTSLFSAMSSYSGGYSGAGFANGVGGWPHTLLLVASTSPLRVKNPWSTNIELNHVLIQRQFLNLQDEAGIKAIVDLVHPDDPTAEMAYDYVEGIPARGAYYADNEFGPTRTGPLLFSCSNPAFVIQGSPQGQYLAPLCPVAIPPKATGPLTPPKDTATTTTPANVNRKVGDSRIITNPDDIRRFIEENRRSDPNGVAKVQGAALTSQAAQAARAPSGSTVNVNRREGDAAQFHNAPKPAVDRPAVNGPTAPATRFIAPQNPTSAPTPAPSAGHAIVAPTSSAPAGPGKP